jgi:replicative DNA helicase
MTAAPRFRLHDRLLAAADEGLEPNLRRWLTFLGPGLGWNELQMLGAQKKWEENQFAHVGSIESAVSLCQQAEKLSPTGVYTIGGAIDPAIATRAQAERWHVQKKGEATTDSDVRVRRVLYVDFDVQRPRGISSTGAQLLAAHDALDVAHNRVAGIVGEGAIGLGHSGNGGCLALALADLPETPELAALVKGVLAALSALHGTSTIKIDLSVTDPKRLFPAFGTMKRKGAPGVAERPHRRTSFVCAAEVERLTVADLERLFAALLADLTDEQKAEVEKAQGKKKPAQAAPTGSPPAGKARVSGEGNSAFRRANDTPVGEVLDWLGLRDGERPKCPGCGESDAGVAIVGNGLKCSHNRCATKGYQAGFRTVVDLVVEVQGLEPVEAVRALADRFGFEPPRPRPVDPPPAPRPKAPAPPPVVDLLLPFRTPRDLPPFPLEALPSAVGHFASALAEELEVPLALPGMLALTALASAVQGKAKVQPRRGWREPLNIYAVVALEPGELKSPAFRRIFSPLYQHDRELREAWFAECARIEAANAEGDGEEESKPAMPRLFADDATPEALARVLSDQGEKITVASDEGTIFGHMCGLYTKTPNNGLFLKGHDGGRYMVDRRIGGAMVLEEPKITFALAVQPEVIRSLAQRPDLRGLGLWARFMYAFPLSRVGSRTFTTLPVDPTVEDAYRELVLDLARRSPPEGDEAVMHLSGPAWVRLREALVVIDQQSGFGGKLAAVRDWASKLRGLIVRIAGLLHMAEHPHPTTAEIGVATIDRALAFGRYALAHARFAFEQEMTLEASEAQALLLWETVQKKGWTSVDKRQVQQRVWALRKSADAQAALEQLVERGYLTKARDGGKHSYVVIERPPP